MRNQSAQPRGAVDRRELIFALIGLCGGFFACDSGCREPERAYFTALGDWLRTWGAAFFTDLAALRRLGAIYLAAHPEERSRVLLSQLLIAGDDGTIPSRLLRAVARDWSSNQVAVVDGWLLARTEARLCAALHLEEGTRS